MAEVLDLKALEAEHARRIPVYQRLSDEIAFILDRHQLAGRGAVIHDITSRIKSFDSLQRKAQSGKFREPLDKIDDLVGFRVVCLLRSHINIVVNFVREHLEVVKERRRNETGAVARVLGGAPPIVTRVETDPRDRLAVSVGGALVHDSKLTDSDPNPEATHRPILYDSGRPSSVI